MRRRFSRLAKIEEKNDQKKALGYLLAAGCLVAVIILWGMPVLSGIFLWLTGNQNSSVSDNTDTIPPSPPQLYSQFEATNSATITIRGLAEPDTRVFVTQNGTQTISAQAEDDGQFDIENMILTEGENQIVSVAMDIAGNRSKESNILKINYSTLKPTLEINTPSENQLFSGTGNQKVTIKGRTDPSNSVFVNDRMLILTATGNFEYRYSCNPGLNTITVTATDKNGNQTQKILNLTYQP